MLKIFSDLRCLEHRSVVGYPESPQRLEGLLEHFRGLGAEPDAAPIPLDIGDPQRGPALDDELLAGVRRVHDAAYVERFRRAVERGDGLIDSADNPLSEGTYDAVLAAVATAVRAADWMARGQGRHAFVAVRPPGHHAERGQAMGFCYLDTVAVAAQHLLDRHGLQRLAILDFDVHHGNGTQHLFDARSDVFFVSLHQFPFYPGTGAASEVGHGAGKGATLNLPLAAGSGDAEYEEVMRRRVLPALRDARPQALLVSAGFDAWRHDPLGGMRVSRHGYRRWGQLLRSVADELTDGCCLSILEGGYDIAALPGLVEAYLRGFEETPE